MEENKNKLLALGCKTMREGVTVSLIFFAAGVMFILVSAYVIPQVWYFQHIIMFVGFMLLLLAPVVLVSTFLISVLPNAKERMDKCDH